MILDSIIWPSAITVIFESYKVDEDDDSNVMDVCRLSGYLKTFIKSGMIIVTVTVIFEATVT